MGDLFSNVSCSLSHIATAYLAWFKGRVPSFGWRAHRPAIGMALVLVLVACGGGAGNTAPAGNELAPDFAISLYQGSAELGAETVNFSDLRGKPVVLNFWAGLCPPCRAEMPDFQRVYEARGDDVIILGVDIGPFLGLGSRQNGRDLLGELSISYPAGTTFDQDVVRDFGVLGMPTTIFLYPDGRLLRTWSGLLNEAKVNEFIDQLVGS